MPVIALLGNRLKSDEIISLLELHGASVIYDFDRLNENSSDVYWASLREVGLQLRFNENQLLDTIFCYIQPREEFFSVSPADIGVPIFDSRQQAELALRASGTRYTSSPNPHFDWVRASGRSYDVHYEFKDGRLAMVTLMVMEPV